MTLLPGFRSRPGGLGAGLLAILLWLFVAFTASSPVLGTGEVRTGTTAAAVAAPCSQGPRRIGRRPSAAPEYLPVCQDQLARIEDLAGAAEAAEVGQLVHQGGDHDQVPARPCLVRPARSPAAWEPTRADRVML